MSDAEWLEWRRTGIGASDVAAIAGLSPWSTPMSVWVDKTIGLPDDQSESMEWGHLLEPVIAAKFAADTGWIVTGEQTWCHHPEHAHHLATVDGFVCDPDAPSVDAALGVLEVKTTGDYPWAELPDAYAIQVQWQLHVTSLDRAWVAVLHMARGRAFRIYEVARDQQMIDTCVRIAERFWTDHVLANEPPPVDGEDATTKAIRLRWPDSDPSVRVELAPEVLEEWRRLRAAAAEAAKAKEEAAQRIRVAMGDAEEAWCDGRLAFTWKKGAKARTFLDKTKEKK